MRLIDADKFEAFGSKIEDAEMGYTTGYVDGVTSVLEAIDAAPTVDAVPVVRCRDCKWHNELGSRDGKGYCQRPPYASGLHGYCHGKDTPPDWYCADAERKEDAT